MEHGSGAEDDVGAASSGAMPVAGEPQVLGAPGVQTAVPPGMDDDDDVIPPPAAKAKSMMGLPRMQSPPVGLRRPRAEMDGEGNYVRQEGFAQPPDEMHRRMEEMQRRMDEMQRMLQQQGSQQNAPAGYQDMDAPQTDKKESFKKVILDEKYFRRIEKFEGDVSKFRAWMFDMMVTIGQVDMQLATEIRRMLQMDDLAENFSAKVQGGISEDIHEKY